ncbi:hypothetical protein Trydic_g13891 [Trypoxylus dichotomus]
MDSSSVERHGFKILQFESLDKNIQKILSVAVETRNNAYCPYSKFQVGAAVLCKDGSIYSGCNVENISFTVGTCAERVAYGKAISEGKREFIAVAVIGNYEFTTPCGACRQYITEFGKVDIYIGNPHLDKIMVTHIDDLLPVAFGASNKPF